MQSSRFESHKSIRPHRNMPQHILNHNSRAEQNDTYPSSSQGAYKVKLAHIYSKGLDLRARGSEVIEHVSSVLNMVTQIKEVTEVARGGRIRILRSRKNQKNSGPFNHR